MANSREELIIINERQPFKSRSTISKHLSSKPIPKYESESLSLGDKEQQEFSLLC